MPNFLFLDLEATSLEPEKARVIELAFTLDDSERYQSSLFNPLINIPYEVSGITGIDDVDVKDKSSFSDSDLYTELKKLVETGEYIAVSHNTDYDLDILSRYGIVFDKSVCTFKLAWGYYKNLANHKLGTLRAFFGITSVGLHRARGDVYILREVFNSMLQDLSTKGVTIENIATISDKAKMAYLNTWPFGKHKGEKIDVDIHKDYIIWNLQNNKNLDKKLYNHLTSLVYE